MCMVLVAGRLPLKSLAPLALPSPEGPKRGPRGSAAEVDRWNGAPLVQCLIEVADPVRLISVMPLCSSSSVLDDAILPIEHLDGLLNGFSGLHAKGAHIGRQQWTFAKRFSQARVQQSPTQGNFSVMLASPLRVS